MKRTWIRVWVDLPQNPKIQKLKPELFRFLVNIWCLAGPNHGIVPETETLTWTLRIPASKITAMLENLHSGGLLDRADGNVFIVHNWNDRQFCSDVSTDRVQRFRERKRNVSGNVSETPSDTDTDTDSEQTHTRAPVSPSPGMQVLSPLDAKIHETAATIYERHPAIRRCGVGEARKALAAISKRAPSAERLKLLETIDENHRQWCESEQWTKDGGEFAKGLDNWLAPTKERYLLVPETPEYSRTATKSEKSLMAASEIFDVMQGGK